LLLLLLPLLLLEGFLSVTAGGEVGAAACGVKASSLFRRPILGIDNRFMTITCFYLDIKSCFRYQTQRTAPLCGGGRKLQLMDKK
jgi:hypothetical protein